MKIKWNPKNEKLTKMNSNASHKLLENNNDLIYVLENNKKVVDNDSVKNISNRIEDLEFWEDSHSKHKSTEIIVDKDTITSKNLVLPPANTNFKKIINKIDQNNESLSKTKKNTSYNEVGSRLYEKGRMKHELNKILFLKKLENKQKEN